MGAWRRRRGLGEASQVLAGDREVEPGIGILRSPGRRAGEGPLRFSPPALVGEGETEVRALRDVSLEIPKGELAVLLGPSGSGKTTLLNQIGALEEPTSGTVEADGVVLADLEQEGRSAKPGRETKKESEDTSP